MSKVFLLCYAAFFVNLILLVHQIWRTLFWAEDLVQYARKAAGTAMISAWLVKPRASVQRVANPVQVQLLPARCGCVHSDRVWYQRSNLDVASGNGSVRVFGIADPRQFCREGCQLGLRDQQSPW